MPDVWRELPGSGGHFYNHTRHVELVRLGYVPELEQGPAAALPSSPGRQALVEARHRVEPGPKEDEVATATAEKKPTRRRAAAKTEAAKPAEKKSAKKDAPSWKDLPAKEKAAHLLAHQTLPDSAWTDEKRQDGEKRDAFIRRILLGEEAAS